MELCTTRRLSAPPLYATSHRINPPVFRISFLGSPPCSHGYGRMRTAVRVNSDDESSMFTEEMRDGVAATLEDVPSVEDTTLNKVVFNDFEQPRPPQPQSEEYSSSSESDEQALPFQELLHNLNIKLDSEDSYQLVLYGGGALVAVWLLSAIVGAIDSIPVVPKLMEVVGLGYSVWFTTRYLLFKKNREELAAKIDELKRDVLGSADI